MSGAGAKEEDLSSLVSSLISLKVLQLSTPGLNPSKFADELLKVHGRAVNFLDAYIEKVDETINYKLLDCLFKEKIRGPFYPCTCSGNVLCNFDYSNPYTKSWWLVA